MSIARALAPRPELLVADEPTSSVDQSAQAQLLNLLHELTARRGLSVLLISHDLSVIRYLTSRVYVMRNGEVVEAGDTEQVFIGRRTSTPNSCSARCLVECGRDRDMA